MEKLFGTDGIRGVANEWPLTPEFITRIGEAIGQVLGRGEHFRVLIGRDTRQSGAMIENALALTRGDLSGQHVQAIIDLAKAQLNAPIDLLEHVRETVPWLASRHRLLLITKGDLFDQETKLARSGLGEYFRDIEVVADKTPQRYAALFRNHSLDPAHVLMVGDSLRSDILPALELGACAVYIPYPTVWQHEAAAAPAPGTPRFYQLEHLDQLPGLLEQLEAQG